MEIPAKVAVFSPTLEVKGKAGTLVAVNGNGFYEITMDFKERYHTVLLPITETVLIFSEPLPQVTADFEVER